MTSAGIWKQSDLPDPVGITVSALRPANNAPMAASWPGRKASNPKTSLSTRRAAVVVLAASGSPGMPVRPPAPSVSERVRAE